MTDIIQEFNVTTRNFDGDELTDAIDIYEKALKSSLSEPNLKTLRNKYILKSKSQQLQSLRQICSSIKRRQVSVDKKIKLLQHFMDDLHELYLQQKV